MTREELQQLHDDHYVQFIALRDSDPRKAQLHFTVSEVADLLIRSRLEQKQVNERVASLQDLLDRNLSHLNTDNKQ